MNVVENKSPPLRSSPFPNAFSLSNGNLWTQPQHRAFPGWEWSCRSWVQQYLLVLGTDGPLIIQSHMGGSRSIVHPTLLMTIHGDTTQDEGLSQDILRSQVWGKTGSSTLARDGRKIINSQLLALSLGA